MLTVNFLLIVAWAYLSQIHDNNVSKQDNPPTLPIGAVAPDFMLPGIDGRMYNLATFKKSKILVIVFTCNHCPTAQSYEDRIISLAADYRNKGVALVAVNPNDPRALRPDELDFSDIGDSFEEMKIRAKEKHFNFPYLYDGKTQKMAKAYGPVATPQVFIFDSLRKLRYRGRIDDEDRHGRIPHELDARSAIESLLNGKEVDIKTTKVFGCSIKWADKKDWIVHAKADWAKEPVTLRTVGESELKDFLTNHSTKLYLINMWATSAADSREEFPELVTINRMYRDRDFVFVTVSIDPPEKKEKVEDFLKFQRASGRNFIFSTESKSNLIQTIDPKWTGVLPYTILVEPGGNIVYAREGPIDGAILKKNIIENHLIGRYY